ncbi:hypothetical protein O6H91_10G024700 [Diphasiastrum complanatum]|uniref:Uncharacterized protein n=1 Tax=Diphasiastrum complanatum TaxID=34168 RepID=A0ACC2CFE5_DIPCM|nr:hypothetical protein O6H91_10G024700 [Diphasiastrum complanatum]
MMSNMQGRGCAKYLMVMLGLLALVECALGVSIYVVGDSAGWSPGNNYRLWEQNHTFVIGDTLVFNYAPQHSVLQVTQTGYQACNVSDVLKSYISGNDRVIVQDSSTFFICGTPGHCQIGMKLAIITASTPSTPINPNPSVPSPGSLPVGTAPTLSPTISGSISLISLPAAALMFLSVATTVPLFFF